MPGDILPMSIVMRSLSWLRGLTARMLVGCGLLVVAFAVVFALLLTALRDLDSKSHWTTHSMNVLALSGKSQNSLSDTTSAATNYVVQGDKTAADRFAAARALALTNPAALEQLVRDNPTQHRAAVTIRAGAELLIR